MTDSGGGFFSIILKNKGLPRSPNRRFVHKLIMMKLERMRRRMMWKEAFKFLLESKDMKKMFKELEKAQKRVDSVMKQAEKLKGKRK